MDEDAGVQAPVTRLRRRLSVEQTEESKSPAVNTPTKKRVGRKTKPELEPVDENTPDNTTSRRATRKAIKDVIEPEEKPVTPSRRSTRIKSNTSIISETALTVDSPRAKRAARRASTAGSDNEAPITPARQTRRTRKDSASSVEKEPQIPPKQGIQITEVIIEEPEGSSSKSVPQLENTNEQSNSTNSTRRSPRLTEKSKKNNHINVTIEESSDGIPLSEPGEKILSQNNSDSISLPSQVTSDGKSDVNTTNVSENKSQNAQNRLSIASAKLIKELNTEDTTKPNLNKSLSTVDTKQSVSKRKRTKSWTTLSTSIDSQFYSDNESTKSKIKNNIKSPLVPINRAGSGDSSLNTSKNQDMSTKSILEKKKKNSMNFTVEIVNEPLEKFQENIEKESKDEISFNHNNPKNDMNTGELLERKPSGDIKTMVFIEDSDSNSEKPNEPKRHENEDQCVPVVEHPVESFHAKEKTFTLILNKNEQNIFNISKRKDSEQTEVEPMDIDETIPENLIIPETDATQLNITERKSTSTSAHISNLTNDEIVNKSGRKSSISNNLEKSGIETKSTLILSQIKDLSAGDISNAVKSPQVTNSKLLSKSVDDLNITQENNIKKNVSLHYSTSTPLQDKNISQKFKGIHVSTPIISSLNNQANEELVNLSKEKNNISKSNNDEFAKERNISKKPVTANTTKENQGKAKKSSDMETINFQCEISQSEIIETKEISDKEKIDNMNISKGEQQNENKSSNVSLSEESIKPSSKDKKSKRNISSSEESEEEIESLDNTGGESHLLDNEAEDAGDDYESGDSQNESERQYEKDHEVIDKGETLTTDDNFSDDSDYEKDSFIVSSNEEDEELLDGTDDDLSMSDNELNMTAKSKKKYNERKLKEQKQASREMFESRHKLNSLNKSTDSIMSKTKNNKRQQISSSESEEDAPTKSKKNHRMRLDSTKEAILHADESEHKIAKKKNKVDTDSSSNESVSNEKEMTVFDESVKESDPLTLIKTEPKTPLKSANSTIAFIDSEEFNNDGIDKNESTKTQTEFDPLHATMFVDEDDDSISSDSEKIQNYDSVLQDLNKRNVKIKTKTCDISLSLDNKRKKNEKSTIVDELNLTQVKFTKKSKKQKEKDNSMPEILPKINDEDDASDSIQLNLLFSEESNNSDTSSVQNKMKADKADSENIIPLKTTEAKTDLRENIGDKEECAMFFVDTDGAHADESHNEIQKNSYNQSTENINAVDKSVNKSVIQLQTEENSDDEAPLEVSYQKEKNSKRKSKIKDNGTKETENAAETSLNESIAKSPASAKKNKKKAKLNESSGNTDNVAEICINDSVAKTPANAKKNKKRAKLNETSEQADITSNTSTNKSLLEVPSSGIKKKDQSESCLEEQNNDVEVPLDSTSEKKKRKKSASNSFTVDNEVSSVTDNNLEAPVDISIEKKKKHKKSASTSFTADNEILSVPDNLEASVDVSIEKKKKRKKSASTSFTETNEIQSVSDVAADQTFNTSEEKTSGGLKKKSGENTLQDNLEVSIDAASTGKKKKNKSASYSFKDENEIPSVPVGIAENETSSKKRKRISSPSTTKEEIKPADIDTAVPLNNSTDGSTKKKRKVVPQDDYNMQEATPTEEKNKQSDRKQDKNTKAIGIPNISKGIDEPNKKRNRKRKDRDEDEASNATSKMQNKNTFIKVSRLPATVLEKLGDVPCEVPCKRPKVISTTEFIVQETNKRRVKPSNYLEESIYLHESSNTRRKNKKRLEKPKVLPFVPTASTSNSGFTTNFKINVLPSDITFVAQSNNVASFRENYLYGNNIRRLRTYDMYKRQRNMKLSKF